MKEYVFISYSHENRVVADGVCHYLEENGIRCWMAPRDIPVGRDYGDLIDEAICGCSAAVLVFSTPASLSPWVRGEINLAFTEGKPILPFRIDETQVKGAFRVMLNQMHWIDAFPQYADRLPDLVSSLKGLLHQDEKVADKASVAPSVLKDVLFTVGGVVKFKMVYVEGGTFMMGATAEQGVDAYKDEKPVHQVTLNGYYIGETVVTQALWKAVMGNNPSHFKGDDRPVENVTWDDTQDFLRKLSSRTGRTFRLPTEAEWEYAARGGKSRGYEYSGSNDIDAVAWYDDNSNRQTHPVRQKRPNELGLYDMSGNVWEWCSDWYGDYSGNAQTNPQGPSSGSNRVYRGGSWCNRARRCRVSDRGSGAPADRDYGLGFRLVLCP